MKDDPYALYNLVHCPECKQELLHLTDRFGKTCYDCGLLIYYTIPQNPYNNDPLRVFHPGIPMVNDFYARGNMVMRHKIQKKIPKFFWETFLVICHLGFLFMTCISISIIYNWFKLRFLN